MNLAGYCKRGRPYFIITRCSNLERGSDRFLYVVGFCILLEIGRLYKRPGSLLGMGKGELYNVGRFGFCESVGFCFGLWGGAK